MRKTMPFDQDSLPASSVAVGFALHLCKSAPGAGPGFIFERCHSDDPRLHRGEEEPLLSDKHLLQASSVAVGFALAPMQKRPRRCKTDSAASRWFALERPPASYLSDVILTTPGFIGVRKNPYPLTNTRCQLHPLPLGLPLHLRKSAPGAKSALGAPLTRSCCKLHPLTSGLPLHLRKSAPGACRVFHRICRNIPTHTWASRSGSFNRRTSRRTLSSVEAAGFTYPL